MSISETQMQIICIADTTSIQTITGIFNVDFFEWHPNSISSTEESLEITDKFDNILWKIVSPSGTFLNDEQILKQELNQRSIRDLNITISSGILYIFKI
jgi:hypothetical protein